MADERTSRGGSGGADESVAYFIAHRDEVEQSRSRRGRWAIVAMCVGVVAASCWVIPAAFGAYDSAAQSRRIQAHGINAHGTVVDVTTEKHDQLLQRYSRFGGGTVDVPWYRSAATIRLDTPIQNHQVVVIGSAEASPARAGQAVTVLLDPHQPAYGEFPGKPVQDRGSWIVLAVFAAVLAALDILVLAGVILVARIWFARRSGKTRPADEGS